MLFGSVFRACGKAVLAVMPAPVVEYALKLDRRLIWCVRNPIDVQMSDHLGKYNLNVNSRYWMETLAYCHRYEPHVMDMIQQLVPQDGIVIDVGANAGIVSIALADKVGLNGRVYAFEPSPVVFPRLQANIALNPSLKTVVILNNLGVGAEDGELNFYEFSHMPGNGRLTAPNDEYQFTPSVKQSVKVITLDGYVQEHGLKIDFIKIDTEGYELNVLQGALETIKASRPTLLLETLNRPEAGVDGLDNYISIESLLKGLNYVPMKYISSNSYQEVDKDSFSDETLFVPEEKLENIMSGFSVTR